MRAPGTRFDIRTPTADEVRAAVDRAIPDVIAPGLAVLFCGINPGLYSAAAQYHFARPGNRFWPALHRAGFTARLLAPYDREGSLSPGSASRASYTGPPRVPASSSRRNSWPDDGDSRAPYASTAHESSLCWVWARIGRRFAIRGRRSDSSDAPWPVHARGSFQVRVARMVAIHWSTSFANCVHFATRSIRISGSN